LADEQIKKLKGILEADLPALNDKVKEAGIPAILIIEKK
jgi:hypothetical protein